MKKAEKKIAKVMREFKKGKLPIGKSKNLLKIENKQQQLLFLKQVRVNLGEKMKKNKKMTAAKTEIGYPNGGKEIQTPKAGEVMTDKVKGQKRMLAEKKSTVTWY